MLTQKTIFITGGAGFIGSNYILMLLKETKYRIINFDALTYAGNLANLSGVENNPNYSFFHGRVEDRDAVKQAFEKYKPDYVVHFAAESHVDRSILDGRPFVISNVLGTQTLLDVAKEFGVERFVHVSTDEVYGSLGLEGVFTEDTPIQPNSPYSASKAGSDLLVRSYFETFNMPCLITRCSNNYGPFQFPEKLIPLMIHNAKHDKALPVYGTGENIRDWIYVEDHCRGVHAVLERGKIGEVYNLGGETELPNIEIVKRLIKILGKDEKLITFVADRLGHDFRYAMGIEKARKELSWAPQVNFEEGLQKTVDWYLANSDWVSDVLSGEYQKYYDLQYSERLK